MIPLPSFSGDMADRIKACVARNSEWSSLGYFEEDRQAISLAISKKLSIPIEEFEDTSETASFHFLTLVLAIARWLNRSGYKEIAMRDERAMNQFELLARSKAMAGILVRLFSHSFVQDLGEVPQLGDMMAAFAQAANVSPVRAGQILTAHTYVRASTLIIARHIADGSPDDDGPPITMDFFAPYEEFLAQDKDVIMPPDAVVDASIQLYSTIKFIAGQPDVPVDIESLPKNAVSAHQFLRNYLVLAGLYRTPATMQLENFSLAGSTLGEVLDSLADERPLVLLDAVFQDVDGTHIILPMNPHSSRSDEENLPAHVSDEIEKLESQPSISVVMYPMG